MLVIGTVAPDNAGQCVEFEVQEFYGRAWHANVTVSCATVSKSDTAGAKFNLTHAGIGYHRRIRSDYSTGTDESDVSKDSAWQCLIVEK